VSQHGVAADAERDLAADVPGLRFRIVPVWGPEETRAEPEADGALERAHGRAAEPVPGA
jgi:hypothetical protein